MAGRRVVLYTQPGCGGCVWEKKWLSNKGVPFAEKDIREDDQTLQELTELGSRGTPAIVINGEVVGFDPKELAEKLGP
jgi:glutaredoxin-like protein NrdH